MFDFYDGGGVDVAILGLAQADEQGNINVSKFFIPGFGARLTGPGGFINISQSSKKVIFAGSFVAKCKEEVKDGELHILQEGKDKKFIKEVEQVTFSGKYAAKGSQEILYITERCVFRLLRGKMTIIEIAPGIDLQKDIIDQMDFVPEVASDLKLMDSDLFQEKWGGLTL
jgi:propionate CoA-transferase